MLGQSFILQQNNAKSCTSVQTHPAYSPNLTSDYQLFPLMAHFLRGQRFANIDFENGCRDYFASKERTWYRKGIELFVECWQKTLKHNGFYFKN